MPVPLSSQLALIVASIISAVVGKLNKDDVVSHLLCPICEQMIKEARSYADKNKLSSGDDYSDLVDNLCAIKKKEGRWVTSIDISQKAGGQNLLQFVRRDDVGECHRECHFSQRACVEALRGKEESLAEMLAQRMPEEKMRKQICKKSCKRKQLPQLPAWEDEEFVARDAAMVTQEDLLPPGMQAYNAQDILSMSQSDQMAFFADQEYKNQQRQAREANEL
mmetsp:Transcript_55676/g.86459  ORF Transcript_55676/g.86459 Transcript_55676/m.86459 type:complete len:221 (-) Transcript_55676:53-715(-)